MSDNDEYEGIPYHGNISDYDGTWHTEMSDEEMSPRSARRHRALELNTFFKIISEGGLAGTVANLIDAESEQDKQLIKISVL